MGELRINLTNFVTVGLMAFVFLFIARRVVGMLPGELMSGE